MVASNCENGRAIAPKFLTKVPKDQLEPPVQFDDGNTMAIKILGLHWLPDENAFSFRTTPMETKVTKRSVLSEIAKLFDPLGFVSPCLSCKKYYAEAVVCKSRLGRPTSSPTSERVADLCFATPIAI